MIGCFLRPWSGSMTLGSFTCPHTHRPAPAFITHKSCSKSTKTSRSQQRSVLVQVYLSIFYCVKQGGEDSNCVFFVPVALLVVLCVCLHSPALCCEAHSQGGVLSSFLIAVLLLLCWRTSYCVHQANTMIANSLSLTHTFTLFLSLSYLPFLHRHRLSVATSLLFLSLSLYLYPLPKCPSIDSKPKNG